MCVLVLVFISYCCFQMLNNSIIRINCVSGVWFSTCLLMGTGVFMIVYYAYVFAYALTGGICKVQRYIATRRVHQQYTRWALARVADGLIDLANKWLDIA